MTMREFVGRLMDQAHEIPTTYTLEDATAQALYDAMQDWMAEYVRINADA